MIFGWFRNRRARKLEEKREAQEYMIDALHRQRFTASHAQIAQSFRQGNPASLSQSRQPPYGQDSNVDLAVVLAAIESSNRVEAPAVPDSAPSFSGYGGGDSGGGGASSDWGSSSSSSSDSSCSSSSDSSSSSSCDSGGGGGSDF